MPGLLNDKKQKPTQAKAKSTDFPEADAKGNASKEEQAQYDEFVTNAMSLMNDEKGLQGLLKAIGGDDNPVEGLANVVASIVMRVEDSADKSGTKISGDVLIHGGAEILEQVADLAEQAGVHEFTEEELESATYMAMDIYRDARQSQGKLDQGAFGQDLKELQAAEADGSLEQQVPGITEHSQRPGRTQPLEGEVIPAGSGPQQKGLLG